MKALATLAAGLSLFAATAATAQDASALEGDWIVDLRLNADDPAYTQPMSLEIDEMGVISGRFYGSAITDGKYGAAQGRQCIAFRSNDNSGPYQHSACLVDGKLVGQSWSEGRGFVLPWTAERK